jgi:hypothetical protein
MARYDTRVAAVALDVEEAWLSSILTRFPVAGVIRRRQGFRRQLSVEAVVLLAIVRALVAEPGLGVQPAVALARRLLDSPTGGVRMAGGHAELTFDVAGTRRRVRAALDGAVATSTEIRRGRPRRKAPRAPKTA